MIQCNSASTFSSGNPGSVGPEQSPASQSAEDQAYMEKLKSLYKYIDPLRRMIKKTEEGKLYKFVLPWLEVFFV